MKFFLIFLFSTGLSCSMKESSAQSQSSDKQNSPHSLTTPASSLENSPLKKQIVSFDSSRWYSLEFSSIPANQITFSSEKISIKVRRSASPLIYPMTKNPIKVKQVEIKGKVDRLVNIQPPSAQGQKGKDDFNLRLGLVFLGDKTLSWYEKPLAAKWVKTLFNLAPGDQGIGHIYFLNAVLSPSIQNQKRTHPLSEYIKEDYAWVMDQAGDFSYSYTFENPRYTGALWISIDGDDSQSDFQLEISEIILSSQ